MVAGEMFVLERPSGLEHGGDGMLGSKQPAGDQRQPGGERRSGPDSR